MDCLSFHVVDSVGPVRPNETPETLWGDDKTDPLQALKVHGFQMRKVILTRMPRALSEIEEE